MRKWLERVALITLGIVIGMSVQWGVSLRQRHLLYARFDSRHAMPDIPAIAHQGPKMTPALCMAMAEHWEALPDKPSGNLMLWMDAAARIGDQRAVPTLIALTDHQDHYVRLRAVQSLYQLRSKISLPALRRMSKDRNPTIAETAQSAIDEMKNQDPKQRQQKP